VARGAPRSGDRTAAGMPRLQCWGACIPLRGRTFLWKALLRPFAVAPFASSPFARPIP
jgi:hypothetical protein